LSELWNKLPKNVVNKCNNQILVAFFPENIKQSKRIIAKHATLTLPAITVKVNDKVLKNTKRVEI